MSGKERSYERTNLAQPARICSSSDDNSAHQNNNSNGGTPPPPYPQQSTSASINVDQIFSSFMDLDELTVSQKAEKRKAEGNDKFKAGSYGVSCRRGEVEVMEVTDLMRGHQRLAGSGRPLLRGYRSR